MQKVVGLVLLFHAALTVTILGAELPCAIIVSAAGKSLDRVGSPYLVDGFKQESYRISQVVVTPDVIEGVVDIESDYASPTEDGFHLSALAALTIESQLAIAGYLESQGFEVKPGEVWMVNYQHRYRRPIRARRNLRLTLKVREEPCSAGSKKRIVHFDIDWEGRAFVGELTLVFENVGVAGGFPGGGF